MKAHYETHFESENTLLEKWKLINPFLKIQLNLLTPQDLYYLDTYLVV